MIHLSIPLAEGNISRNVDRLELIANNDCIRVEVVNDRSEIVHEYSLIKTTKGHLVLEEIVRDGD